MKDMELISKDTIKELFDRLIQLNISKFEFIYNAKQNTFGYADIKELYYKGNSIFIASQSEMLKFQEYRLNLEMDLMENESSKDLLAQKEDLVYINDLKVRVNRIKELETTNKIIQDELDAKTNDYKKMAMEVGQVIFQNEDYEYEIKKLKEKIESLNNQIEMLETENNELKKFKEEVESSTTWKLKSKFS